MVWTTGLWFCCGDLKKKKKRVCVFGASEVADSEEQVLTSLWCHHICDLYIQTLCTDEDITTYMTSEILLILLDSIFTHLKHTCLWFILYTMCHINIYSQAVGQRDVYVAFVYSRRKQIETHVCCRQHEIQQKQGNEAWTILIFLYWYSDSTQYKHVCSYNIWHILHVVS